MKTLSFLLISILVAGCAISRNVRPLGEGKSAVGASLGGPLVGNFGVPVPLPQISAFYRRGLSDKTDIDFGLYFPITGVMGVDAGGAYSLFDQAGAFPALNIGARVILFGNGRAILGQKNPRSDEKYKLDLRVFEEVYVLPSWKVSENVLLWTGASAFIQVERPLVRPVLVFGSEWALGPRLGLGAELKYADFFRDQEFNPIDTLAPFHKGSLALHLALTLKFGVEEPLPPPGDDGI